VDDTDCTSPATCTAGACLYPGTQCGEACTTGTGECAQGLLCFLFTNTCLPVCTSNADCPGGDCLVISTYGVCLSCPPPVCDPPCTAEQECVEGQCLRKCFPPCDFGFLCDDGTCQAQATDCAPACTPGDFCWSQTCQSVDSSGCPAGMIRLTSPSVCVDRFEASLRDGELGDADGTGTTATAASVNGALPITWVTYPQARQICLNTGKRLCTATEWQALCTGPGFYTYPYGDSYLAGVCNTDTGALYASRTGSFVGCVSQVGGVDFSGNVWEWSDTPYTTSDTREIYGGGFASTPENSTCTSELNALNGGALPLTEARDPLGFRCCKTP
jgi:hypothetical protein